MRRRSLAATVLAPLLLLIAALAAPATQAGGGCHAPDGSVYMEGDATVIRMDICSFSPTIARVPVGTTVRFLNTSTVEHAVVGRASTWASDILPVGKDYSETFAAAGLYPFSCPLHPGMVGAIVVGGDAPAAAPAVAEPSATTPDIAQASATVGSTGTNGTSMALAAVVGLGAGVVLAGLIGAVRNARRGTPATPTSD